MIKIKLASVPANDQNKARKFYREVLGFIIRKDIPMGPDFWLTVASPAAPDEVELLLEPAGPDFAKTFQQAMFTAGIPATAFAVDDIQKEFQRLKKLGVAFKSEPAQAGPAIVAVFDDTCGNYIQLFQL